MSDASSPWLGRTVVPWRSLGPSFPPLETVTRNMDSVVLWTSNSVNISATIMVFVKFINLVKLGEDEDEKRKRPPCSSLVIVARQSEQCLFEHVVNPKVSVPSFTKKEINVSGCCVERASFCLVYHYYY